MYNTIVIYITGGASLIHFKRDSRRSVLPRPVTISTASAVEAKVFAQRSTDLVNHGKRSRKSNQDCTICRSCRWNASGCFGTARSENAVANGGKSGG